MLKEKESKQSIQVTIRVRPLSEKQTAEDARVCVRVEAGNHSIELNNAGQAKKFTFDSICHNDSQEDIFVKVGRKSTTDCIEGYNCTIFAYGQTGAGKTYTMMGVNSEQQNYLEQRGLIPRTLEYLFQCIEAQRENGVDFIIKCSFLQIYNEQIIDLLNKLNTNLQIREDAKKGVYVQGITEEPIQKAEDALEILQKGSKSRHVGSTCYNEASSRSHSVFTMEIESRESRNGVVNTKTRQFHFIDLAGSERTKQIFGERLKEGCSINKALLNLGTVINSLSESSEGKAKHVNYRDSKLTFLLKDSLGGNSKTHLIANISPSTMFYQQSLSTLGFARRVKLIKREKASINEDSSGNLESMKNEIKRLKQEIISLKSSGGSEVSVVKDGEMTGMLKQYVCEQIDKQTKLEVEIFKLKHRITQLQSGIQQYSRNETHLRLIIKVYEDKMSRLKEVQQALLQKGTALDKNTDTKELIDYFREERTNLLRELEAFRAQNMESKYMKELLKAANLYKEDGEEDSLQHILDKNNQFLQAIKGKLDELQPQRIEIQCTEQFERKVELLEVDFSKRETEYQERIDQLHLELAQTHAAHEETENLLREAVGVQISLEDKLALQKREIESLDQQLKAEKTETTAALALQNTRLAAVAEERETVMAEKKGLEEAREKDRERERQREREFQESERAWGVQVEELERQLQSKAEQTQNVRSKCELEMKVMGEEIEALRASEEQRRAQLRSLQSAFNKEKKQQQKMGGRIAILDGEKSKLLEEKRKQMEESMLKASECDKLKKVNEELRRDREQIREELSRAQEECRQERKAKEEKVGQLMKLLTEKQKSGSEMTRMQINNLQTEKDSLESKLKTTIKDYEEKIRSRSKESEAQMIQLGKQIARLHDELLEARDSANKASRNAREVTQSNQELRERVADLQQSVQHLEEKISTVNSQLHLERLNHKNLQIELALQLEGKQDQIASLESQLASFKAKSLKQVQELERTREKTIELMHQSEEAVKRATEAHLTLKEKKIAELTLLITNLERNSQDLTLEGQEWKAKAIELGEVVKVGKQWEIKAGELQAKLERERSEHQAMMRESELKYERLFESNELAHNEQLDEKNEVLDNYLSQIETHRETIAEKDAQMALMTQEMGDLQERLKQLTMENISLSTCNLQLLGKTDESVKWQDELAKQAEDYEEQIKVILEKSAEDSIRMQALNVYIEELRQKWTEESAQLAIEKTKYEARCSLQAAIQTGKLEIQERNKQLIEINAVLTENNVMLKEKTVMLAKKCGELEVMKVELQKASHQLEKKREDLGNVQKMAEQVYEKNVVLECERDQALRDMAERSAEVSELASLNKQLQNKIDLMGDLKGVEDTNRELSRLNERIQEQNSQLSRRSETIREDSRNLLRRNQELEERLRSIDAQLKSLLQSNQALTSRCGVMEKAKGDIQIVKGQLAKERETNAHLKMIIENSESQKIQLQQELHEKGQIYNKLLEKIARFESQHKRIPNADHYLKTIELLEKSRAEQLELKKLNQELRKAAAKLKEQLEVSNSHVNEVNSKSESYCILMQKRLEEIQNDYYELERNQERTLKEKKVLQKLAQESELLKEEIKAYRASLARANGKAEELESKIKAHNIEYIHLQKEYEELKKDYTGHAVTDEKATAYINKLKAEIASLRVDKNTLTESLTREREDRSRPRGEPKYGDSEAKIENDKLRSEKKYLHDLLSQIAAALRISLSEPKFKMDTLRGLLLGSVKEKNNQITLLKERNRDLEREIDTFKYPSMHETREKISSISHSKRANEQSCELEQSNILRDTVRNKVVYSSILKHREEVRTAQRDRLK